jgi:hypothetical protein
MTTIDNVIDAVTTPAPPVILQATAALAYGGPNGAPSGNSFRNWEQYAAARPDLVKKGWLTSVTLTSVSKCRCYDIEPGGGVNGNIGVFMRNADRTHGLPWLYTFESNGAAMIAAARGFGYRQGHDYYVLSAHPGTKSGKHICGPHVCGAPFTADGTQWNFAGSFDASLLNDYMLPGAKPKPTDAYGMFPTFVGDLTMPNQGNERLTVEQTDGALEHPDKFRGYLKGQLRSEIKEYRDRLMRISTFQPPNFAVPRKHADWSHGRGKRWQGLNRRIERIDAIS